MAHTKGPWFRTGNTVYALNDRGTNSFTALVQAGAKDANPSTYKRMDALEVEANARLMAYAPDLLEALKSLLLEPENVLQEVMYKGQAQHLIREIEKQNAEACGFAAE